MTGPNSPESEQDGGVSATSAEIQILGPWKVFVRLDDGALETGIISQPCTCAECRNDELGSREWQAFP